MGGCRQPWLLLPNRDKTSILTEIQHTQNSSLFILLLFSSNSVSPIKLTKKNASKSRTKTTKKGTTVPIKQKRRGSSNKKRRGLTKTWIPPDFFISHNNFNGRGCITDGRSIFCNVGFFLSPVFLPPFSNTLLQNPPKMPEIEGTFTVDDVELYTKTWMVSFLSFYC